jgi:hypothetical protein
MSNLTGFSRDFTRQECPAIGIFGGPGTGKTRICATAGEYARDRGKTPGWIVLDRKTRKTVREVCAELKLDTPYINKEDFIPQADALALATNGDFEKVKAIYTKAIERVLNAATALGAAPEVDPIIFETGSGLWDWIAFAHFGRKQDAGKSRVWGPPKQDWTDLFDSLQHKTVLITLWERDEYKNDARTGFTKPDGPPHLGYTTTTLVRLTQDRTRKLQDGETYVDRFGLDIVESQDNKGLESVNNVLTGEAITYANLISMLRTEE